jgi:ABC-type transporter Mla MlaB component
LFRRRIVPPAWEEPVPELGPIVVEPLPKVVVVVPLCGEHDISTVPAVRTELDAALAGNANLVVDLSEATFIDSSVVRVLFHAATLPVRIVAIAAAPGSLHDV